MNTKVYEFDDIEIFKIEILYTFEWIENQIASRYS